jgi:hypothetical protein
MFTRVPKLERGGFNIRCVEKRGEQMQNDRGDIIYTPAQAAAIATALYLKEDPPELIPETPRDVTKRLEAELSTLRAKLAAVNAAALRGDITAIRNADLPQLTIELAATQNALEAARQAQQEAEQQELEAARAEREGRFPQVVEEARNARDEARRAFRSLAVALGKYCAATREAIRLNGELRSSFPDPDRWNLIHDIENRAALSPLHELMDAGYSPLMDFGHDLSLSVPPLLMPGQKEESTSYITLPPMAEKAGK